jgi:hypothetical protein
LSKKRSVKPHAKRNEDDLIKAVVEGENAKLPAKRKDDLSTAVVENEKCKPRARSAARGA